ncbi:primary-amine oxidase [Alicyclobacillus tolerans]|uniref:primary-amine oxidase n=1 Tax=Alicyclobacillus tolerans TaxID=90970 RepID=UPI001F39A788|nr:primary-amine oxidase [Alicyclobacillus tolerans]MCF8565111.1 primary-amine oxidase [Alicyclobacillus tolerans]
MDSITTKSVETTEASKIEVRHPLEPLTREEIAASVAILRSYESSRTALRFVSVTLHEPPKELVQNYQPGDPVEREAFMVLLDNADGQTYEAIVSITGNVVKSLKHIPGVQPSIMLDEFEECERVVKANPEFQAALRKRGITDFDLVMVDPWSSGNFGSEEERTTRLSRTLSWVRTGPKDNGYAHPIEGVIAVVDLNKMEVIRVEDYGVTSMPWKPGNYTPDSAGSLRTDLKPLDILQPEGPSFAVNGHEVQWQKWRFRIGFTPREGLVLYTIGYEDQGKLRPILHRVSLSEMVVPYGDPGSTQRTKNAFDAGEYGIGMLANSLELGCDCLGLIRYFDAHMTDSRGNVITIPNAICMHEEDYGTNWKHFDWRTGDVEVRRSRRLVVSSFSTVANYEYGFFWYFYLDGTIQLEIKLTGIVSTASIPFDEKRKYGTVLAPGLYAPNHQHFFNIRLDMNVDGPNNSVYEVNVKPESQSDDNPYANAFYAESTLLSTEQEAQRHVDLATGRYWKIANPSSRNSLGDPVAFKLIPGENAWPFAAAEASVTKRAGFVTKHLWVTPYSPEEKYAAGDYPNQHLGGAGLPEWTQRDRPVENTDIVLWYTIGHTHIPRLEDWPVMPAAYTGFLLKPVGFFEQNPALDVPPPVLKHSCCAM